MLKHRRTDPRFDRALVRRALHLGLAGATLGLAGCADLAPLLTSAQVSAFATDVTGALAEATPPLEGALDVEAAVRRAIMYNQEIQAARREAAINDAQLRIERGELLPDVLANLDYYGRNERQSSRSNASPDYSSSSDLVTLSRRIELSFNLIDFGLTLLRMRQAADRANIKREDVARVAFRIAEETRAAYWRAVALQMLVPEITRLSGEVDGALNLSRRAVRDPAIDPVEAINYQRELLNTRRELNDVYSGLAGADHQLRNLAAIPSGSAMVLSARREERFLNLALPAPQEDVGRALRQRPEIRQHMYEMRLNSQDADAAILKILPGATVTQALESDSTSYLLHGDWVSWSTRLAASLLEIVRLPGRLDEVEARQEFERQSAIASVAAIAMQVHVARARLVIEAGKYRDAEEFSQNQQKLLRQVLNAVAAGRLPEQMIVRERLAALLARTRAVIAYGELHAAFAAYQSALGEIAQTEIAQFNRE